MRAYIDLFEHLPVPAQVLSLSLPLLQRIQTSVVQDGFLTRLSNDGVICNVCDYPSFATSLNILAPLTKRLLFKEDVLDWDLMGPGGGS